MNLYKQISLIMSLFLLFVLVSVMSYNFQSAKKYAQEELANSTQNTATYLSISLGKTGAETSEMSTMINAVFDSGNFQEIRLLDTHKKVIFQRNNSEDHIKVPQWFTSMYELKTPHSTATISSGWKLVGTVTVVPMLDNTHLKLYNNFLSLLESFFFFSLIAFTLLFFLLRLLLASLRKMTEQAEAVSNNNFIINQDIPSTTEFKEVTLAMNKMVTKVKNIFEKEANSAKEYHKLLYTDALTGLGNRNYFELKLNEFIISEEIESKGVILNIFLEGISYANKSIGHEKVDALLYELCSVIKQQVQKEENTVIARLDGTKTSIIFTNRQKEDIEEISKEILTQAIVLLEKLNLNADKCCIKITQLRYGSNDNVSSLLNQIEKSFSLTKKNTIFFINSNTETSINIGTELIKSRLNAHAVSLAMQDVYDIHQNILHAEAYVRLYDENKNLFEARDFLPIIQAHNLGVQLDKNVINHALKISASSSSEIAINLSLDFLQDASAIQWLKERLRTQGRTKVFNFEVSNHVLLHSIAQANYLSTMLREMGHNFAIDRFSIDENSNLNYLQMIQPAYLKIDSCYLRDMLKDENGVTNPALQIITESIDAKIIATNIENSEMKGFLQKAGIKYFQGSYLGEVRLV